MAGRFLLGHGFTSGCFVSNLLLNKFPFLFNHLGSRTIPVPRDLSLEWHHEVDVNSLAQIHFTVSPPTLSEDQASVSHLL